jgi:hypothetical protein
MGVLWKFYVLRLLRRGVSMFEVKPEGPMIFIESAKGESGERGITNYVDILDSKWPSHELSSDSQSPGHEGSALTTKLP